MPLYELICLCKPGLPRPELAAVMQRLGELVLNKGGVLTSIKSFGELRLAYDIRRPFEKYRQVSMAARGRRCV
jgi:small subunit ribosomal protein S6